MQRLRRRADFLKAAAGSKAAGGAFVLQAAKRGENGAEARIGFTVSKKVGNAVERNRVRRRLREIVKRSETLLRPGYDYVVVGRRIALQAPFDEMVATFNQAVRRVHAQRRPPTH